MNAKKTAVNKKRFRGRRSTNSIKTILGLALMCIQTGAASVASAEPGSQANDEITQEESVRLRNFSRLNKQDVIDEAAARTGS